MALMFLTALALAATHHAVVRPFKLQGGGHKVWYDYSWPAEARAIPPLHKYLLSEMRHDRADIVGMAKESRGEDWFERSVGYESTITYELNAENARLLSLSGHHSQYTGGAHANGGATPLLWDKALHRAIKVTDLFAAPAEYALLAPRYCAELDKERRKRRGGNGKLRTFDEFDQCPKFSDLSVEIIDENENGRFDHLRFTADPYLAGPYSEGEYVIDLPVTKRLLDTLKATYRPSFEAQRQ